MRLPPTRRSPWLWAAVCLLASACGAHTELSTVWSSKVAHPPLRRLLVMGVSENPVTRRAFEDAFAAALNERGAEAAPSYLFLPGDERLTEDMVQRVVRERGIEGVLVTRLLKVDKDQQYVPPQTYVSSGMGYGGYYGYYGAGWDVVTTPGYWRTVTIVRLETQLYDTSDNALVWAAQSDTFDPSSVDATIKSVTKKISARMADDGLLAKP